MRAKVGRDDRSHCERDGDEERVTRRRPWATITALGTETWSQEEGKKLQEGGGQALKATIKYSPKLFLGLTLSLSFLKSQLFLRNMRLKGSECWLWLLSAPPQFPARGRAQQDRPGLLTQFMGQGTEASLCPWALSNTVEKFFLLFSL